MPNALIWGASGGIGGALARLLKTQGWGVYAVARDESKIFEGVDFSCTFDAGDGYSIQAAISQIATQTTELDLVVYAAGGLRLSSLEDTEMSLWKEIMNANLTGVQQTARASLLLLKEDGHMMILGAYVEKITLPRFGAYAAAKAALEPLVAVLVKEQRKRKFTLVRPPAVATPFWAELPISVPKNALTPEFVAEAMLARYESGETGWLDL